MKTAIVILAANEHYLKGAKTLLYSLRKYGQLPDWITPLILDSSNPIENVPIASVHHPEVVNKLKIPSLDFKKIIMLDADMLCVGDCSYLWSKYTDTLPIYAVKDPAAKYYYPESIATLKLDPEVIFNCGTVVYNNMQDNDIIDKIVVGDVKSYDGSDQGYLNYYFQKFRPAEIGNLPPEYNCCLDLYFPNISNSEKRLIHFSGAMNPWDGIPQDWRAPFFQTWHQINKEMLEAK